MIQYKYQDFNSLPPGLKPSKNNPFESVDIDIQTKASKFDSYFSWDLPKKQTRVEKERIMGTKREKLTARITTVKTPMVTKNLTWSRLQQFLSSQLALFTIFVLPSLSLSFSLTLLLQPPTQTPVSWAQNFPQNAKESEGILEKHLKRETVKATKNGNLVNFLNV